MPTNTVEAKPIRDRFPLQERSAVLRKYRKLAALTQTELAELAQVSQSKLSAFEAGRQDLGEEAYWRVVKAVTRAAADRRWSLQHMVPLSSLGSLSGLNRQTAHFINVKERTENGGFSVEYQGPGMIVCEDYRFENEAELRQWLQECVEMFEKVVFSSDLAEER